MWEKLKDAEKEVTEFRSSYKTCKEELSVENEDTVYHLIKDHAYNHDAMWRTLQKKETDAQIDENKKESVIKWIQGEIKKILKSGVNNQEDFDKWHESTCKLLTDKINNEVLSGYEAVHIGKAQKVINMSFKYLSSLDGSEKYNRFFEYCHVPLDDNILKIYREFIDSDQKTAWSNLDYNEYKKIQENFREYCSREQCGSPLLWEWQNFKN